jgi:Trypsin
MERHTRHHTIATIVITAAATINAALPASIAPASAADSAAAVRPALSGIADSPTHVELVSHVAYDSSATAGSDNEKRSPASEATNITTVGVPTHRSDPERVATGAAATLIAEGLVNSPVTQVADADARLNVVGELTRPHVLTTEIADVIVRVRGAALCTGTPITGTSYVVTAAHCILDGDGEVASATVLRQGVEYTAVSVLVDREYHDSPGPRLDAAVLVMERMIPGPSATLGDTFPPHGPFTLAGFQPLDTDGSLLRGTRYDDRPDPQGATGPVIMIDTAAAGCVHLASELEITGTQVKVPCGLIPGASGGGLFVEDNGERILVGITSTVAYDLTYNGVVLLAALHELLDNPPAYTYTLPSGASPHTARNVARS